MTQTKVEAPFVENNIPFRNVIINGDMVINQRGSSSVTGLGGGGEHYFLDRIRNYSANTAGRYTISQETDVPAGLGFTNSVKFQCTTADTSVAASELTLLQQQIAGENLQRFNKGTSSAKQFTVSFYAKANESRVHALELVDTDNSNRHISKLFTVTTDWKRHVITFPADTTGAFDNDSNKSMSMIFWLHAGSSYTSGTLNSSAWGSLTDANRAVGIGSLMASTDNNFLLTGLQLEVGDKASEFEFLPHDVQLQRCQRYYFKLGPGAQYDIYCVGASNGTDSCYGAIHYPVQMRGDPTLGHSGTAADYCVYQGSHNPFPCDVVPASNTIYNYAMRLKFGCTGDMVAGEAGELLAYNTSAYLEFDAEI